MAIWNAATLVTSSKETIEQLNPTDLGPPPTLPLGGWAKRTFDLTLSICALGMFIPLFVLIAVAVRLSSPGPVLYGHRRIGYAGREFKCWKFRTMVKDGDALLDAYLRENPDERHEWITNRKLRADPRVTRIGAVLRTYSVDELPQIINVLMGDMSIVGPRPVVMDELNNYGSDAQLYLRSRPGITGLWQVSGRSDVGYEQRVSLDAEYVTRWSFPRDIGIIIKTIPAVIAAKGSY